MKINVGDVIAWYPETKSTYKLCTLYPNMDIMQCMNVHHFVFKYVEAMFEEWFSYQSKDTHQCYLGWGEDEPAAFERKGAIRQAIEDMFEEMQETGKPVHVHSFDVEAAFQC